MGLAERIVWRFPVLLDAAATYKGWRYDRQRHGRVYRDTCAELEARATWSREQLAAYQGEQLRALIGRAAEHVPYYRELFREHGISADDVQRVEDLRKLPLLDKPTFRAERLRMIDERLDPQKLVTSSTSGTTGVPVHVDMLPEDLQRHYAFFEVRSRRVAGFEFKRRPYVMLGAQRVVPPERELPPFWAYNRVWKQLYMSVFHLSEAFLPAYVQALRGRPYHAAMSYPSSLQLLAEAVLADEGPPIRFVAAITSGELLYPEQRATIEEAFGCRVFDQYGCSENCIFAAQCPEGSMHLSIDYAATEIVDDAGQPVAPGEVGNVVTTGFMNRAQPLIRYQLGDRAAISEERCACGSPLPVLTGLDGRASGTFITRDGRRVSRLSSLMAGVNTVGAWQVVQEDIERFRVRIVPDAGFAEGDEKKLVDNVRNDFGPVEVAVERVEAIQAAPSGKVRLMINEVPQERINELAMRSRKP